MEMVEFHKHPLLPVTRFSFGSCKGCSSFGYIYGGYRCNELGCEEYVYHKECAELLPEINHSSHPDHPLKLLIRDRDSACNRCGDSFKNGYFCSICDVKLDIRCAKGPTPLLILEKTNLHDHPLHLGKKSIYESGYDRKCKACDTLVYSEIGLCYKCYECKLVFHEECDKFFPEANHTSHPQHPLKLLSYKAAPKYADKKCLLCGMGFDQRLHHCDICNFSICSRCMSNPPPLVVVSRTTHEHQLHLFPRRMDFTCNACGMQGNRSPYFCLQCNFMIHRKCIDLPRVININRHNHRISYTRRLGHGDWKCGVGLCSKKVDGFYGAYSCSKCPKDVFHASCATRNDVWDMIELEGTPEEPEEPPFVVIDDNTIKHFSHDHNLRINKDGGMLHESILCQACVFQICSELFYNCEECDFILHEKCANLPRKKRHLCDSLPFTLDTNSEGEASKCYLCRQDFTGFRYMCLNRDIVLDVRCSSLSEPFVHESHQHPLYYTGGYCMSKCTACGDCTNREIYSALFNCDQCDFRLGFKCAILPHKVMRYKYDDHPLCLSYSESSVDGEYYWCEACETKVNPRKWFYTCKDCGVALHISCVVGDVSYVMPGSVLSVARLAGGLKFYDGEVVPNTSICRPICTVCNSRCKLPSILQCNPRSTIFLQLSMTGYVCSLGCH
ncbi:Protein VACUOLELESS GAMETOPHYTES [Cardamine amara subsp. amara]|uniref:Protein VACUOLELESS GAMETOPHYTES n=1 Tax=Cardamine amara subsp. amara TaxID=228776 RepID=A0ABD1BUB3_CARAN